MADPRFLAYSATASSWGRRSLFAGRGRHGVKYEIWTTEDYEGKAGFARKRQEREGRRDVGDIKKRRRGGVEDKALEEALNSSKTEPGKARRKLIERRGGVSGRDD